MPLSEHEERALQEIARRLSEEDPKFVATVSQVTPAKARTRRIRLSVVGFVVGLLSLLGLAVHFAFGVVGFALMLSSVIYGARAVRGQAAYTSADVFDRLRKNLHKRDR